MVEEQLQYAELQKWEKKFDHKREVYVSTDELCRDDACVTEVHQILFAGTIINMLKPKK
mgnify:FL=1